MHVAQSVAYLGKRAPDGGLIKGFTSFNGLFYQALQVTLQGNDSMKQGNDSEINFELPWCTVSIPRGAK